MGKRHQRTPDEAAEPSVGAPQASCRRFGPFVFRPDTLELLRSGGAVHLRPQAAKALKLLTDRPGSLVSREDLRDALWDETIVEFDKSINWCILQIRRALDDNAKAPRFVETLPRRGYRFIAPVAEGVVGRQEPTGRWSRRLAAAAAAALVILGTVLATTRSAEDAETKRPARPFRAEAERLYLEGRHLLRQGDLQGSIDHFDRALRVDEFHSLAWTGLGEAYLRRQLAGPADQPSSATEFSAPARAALHRALDLDPDLAPAHLRMGDLRSIVDWDFEASRREYETAIELDPGLVEGHLHLATYFLIAGDLDAAMRKATDALALDPDSPRLAAEAGWIHLYGGRPGEAIELCQQALDSDPGARHSRECLVRALESSGDAERWQHHARQYLVELGLTGRGAVEALTASAANPGAETPFLRFHRQRLDLLDGQAKESHLDHLDRALSQAALGNTDASLRELEAALTRRSPLLLFRFRDPGFASLRGEPRFERLLRVIGVQGQVARAGGS